MTDRNDGLQTIIDQALESMAAESGGDFDPQKCNLAEFCRRTGLSRQRARTIKENGFRANSPGDDEGLAREGLGDLHVLSPFWWCQLSLSVQV